MASDLAFALLWLRFMAGILLQGYSGSGESNLGRERVLHFSERSRPGRVRVVNSSQSLPCSAWFLFPAVSRSLLTTIVCFFTSSARRRNSENFRKIAIMRRNPVKLPPFSPLAAFSLADAMPGLHRYRIIGVCGKRGFVCRM